MAQSQSIQEIVIKGAQYAHGFQQGSNPDQTLAKREGQGPFVAWYDEGFHDGRHVGRRDLHEAPCKYLVLEAGSDDAAFLFRLRESVRTLDERLPIAMVYTTLMQETDRVKSETEAYPPVMRAIDRRIDELVSAVAELREDNARQAARITVLEAKTQESIGAPQQTLPGSSFG